MPRKTLRNDQSILKNDILAAWNAGIKNVLAQLPTGGGKSVVMSDLIFDKNETGNVQVVLAHRTELVLQMSMHLAEYGIHHALIAPKAVINNIIRKHRKKFNGYSFVNPTANCFVGGVDTLKARKDTLTEWAKQVDFWYIDEAHHVLLENKWGEVAQIFTNAKGLGVTASPKRADGCGLGREFDGVFDTLVCGPEMRELINLKALCDYEIVIPESDFFIEETTTASGDFSPVRMKEASEKSRIVGDVVATYCKYSFGKRGIVFATDVATAGKMAKQFNLVGIKAVSISAKTPTDTRLNYLERFENGLIDVLVNVDLFGEGFDVPAVEVVIMARPTASLVVYLQQFGRVLRWMENKAYGLVIDHVSNWKRHGLPDKPHFWSLSRRDKRAKSIKDPEEIDLIACKACSRPYQRVYAACPHCGNVPNPTTEERASIEQIDGNLVLLDRAKLAEMRAATELPSPADVAARAAYVAGPIAGKAAANRQIERFEAQDQLRNSIAQWAGNERAKGRDDEQSYKRFYLTSGVDVLSALALPTKEMKQLTERVNQWMM